MSKSSVTTSKNSPQNWILLGIPILFIIGFFMHYIYEWSGNSLIVGIFAPINESVWEHLKLTFWPMLIWWIAGYIILGKKNNISASQWFTSCTVAELICPLVVLCFYYTYTGALGIESLILDIFSLFLGIAVAQGLALHVYKYARFSQYCLYISVAILILLAVTFTVFTFAPPLFPLFKDSVTGKYGI
ncbi:DUF6512 family protein [Lachnoclostridium phytofermentans]|uniref:DUF6512 family protein n=1 Tax=Lachnoclostridium phytofermentans TaxID=66219 RepID=UPI0002D4977C|nr:DUF6512 family protein [Lachnoclostridium phytofermentans]